MIIDPRFVAMRDLDDSYNNEDVQISDDQIALMRAGASLWR